MKNSVIKNIPFDTTKEYRIFEQNDTLFVDYTLLGAPLARLILSSEDKDMYKLYIPKESQFTKEKKSDYSSYGYYGNYYHSSGFCKLDLYDCVTLSHFYGAVKENIYKTVSPADMQIVQSFLERNFPSYLEKCSEEKRTDRITHIDFIASYVKNNQLEIARRKKQAIVDAKMDRPQPMKGFMQWGEKAVKAQEAKVIVSTRGFSDKNYYECLYNVTGEKFAVLKSEIKNKDKMKVNGVKGLVPIARTTKPVEEYISREIKNEQRIYIDRVSENEYMERFIDFYAQTKNGKITVWSSERYRVIFDVTKDPDKNYEDFWSYNGKDWKKRSKTPYGWSSTICYGMYCYYNARLSKLYKPLIRKIMREDNRFKYSAMDMLESKFYPSSYMTYYLAHPQVESLIKVGLENLLWTGQKLFVSDGKPLAEAIGISKEQFSFILNHKDDASTLLSLFRMGYSGVKCDDFLVKYMKVRNISGFFKGLDLCGLGRDKAMNYIQKQAKVIEHGDERGLERAITLWSDYLTIAHDIGIDISKEILALPRDLKRCHDDAANSKRNAGVRSDVFRNYPDIDKKSFTSLNKYEYDGEQYIIKAPTCVEDIIKEGNAQGHCVAASTTYLGKIYRKDSYIMFLRKKSDPDKAYYTVEAKPNGEWLQCYGYRNQHFSDMPQVKQFLAQWKENLSKVLTQSELYPAKTA